MTSSEPWERLVEAENQYDGLRMRMDECDFDDQIGKALASPSGRAMALRILRDVPVEHVERHVDQVFDFAARTHGPVGLAREVLSRLSFDFATDRLGPLVEQRTRPWIERDVVHDDEMWEDFQRSAEVLDLLGQRKLLEDLVTRAQQSKDPDVLEVAASYKTGTYDPAE